MERPAFIEENVPLAPLTTLGVGGSARYFARVADIGTLRTVITWARAARLRIAIIGGGSNVLVSDDGFDGLVVQICIQGVTYRERGEYTEVVVGAGVILDTLIEEVVEQGLWGLENLSAIPGTVGAVPIQNVGAYGVEAKDVVHSVTAYDEMSGELLTLSNADCRFGYRDSIFKHEEGKRYVVTQVTFTLSRIPTPRLAYKDLREHFGESVPTLKEIRTAVTAIRGKKFPDWHVTGTAGSFFKNPIVSSDAFVALRETYPGLPGYEQSDGVVKLSLGWILDHVCGLKGYSSNGVGLFKQQALVLVCEKGVSASAVEKFSSRIIDLVFQKTKIIIEREVVHIV